jgi:membrane protease YdiL (CAAX protease family)
LSLAGKPRLAVRRAERAALEPPLWAVGLAVLRAGTVEEICYRGFAIERLQSLTGNRAVAIGLPLALSPPFTTVRATPGS